VVTVMTIESSSRTGTSAIVMHGPSLLDLPNDSAESISTSTGVRPYPPMILQRTFFPARVRAGLDPFRGQVAETRHFEHSMGRFMY